MFLGDPVSEYTSPIEPDAARATADLPIAELGLAPGARVAYLFDFGDEWRVLLTLREFEQTDGRAYPRVLRRDGTPRY